MSALLKNLHVHFEDDVLSKVILDASDSATKKILDDEMAGRKSNSSVDSADSTESTTTTTTTTKPKINYTRSELLELRASKVSKEPPKVLNLSGADDKRKEKLRNVLKNTDLLKSLQPKNGVSNGTVASKSNVTETNEQVRSNFQQMISAAVTNAQQQNAECTATRRRIGSGRIVDSGRDHSYPIGMDVRYMRNKLFKEDGKPVKNWKFGTDFNWNNSESVRRDADNDNMDAKSDEPEWANCGPISKHDIIELHGFDGPEDDDTQKRDGASVSPPARSTPSKNAAKKTVKSDDHFNFDDFLKLDLPPSVNCSRDLGTGESRFSQWFGRDKLPYVPKYPNQTYESKSAQQLFDYHQKVNQQKMNAPNKFRSVDELEADWYPGQVNAQSQPTTKEQQNGQTMNISTIQRIINQLAMEKQRRNNYLLALLNKNAENSHQYHMKQSIIMKSPDAQLLLHKLVNREITQYHLLQQISSPTLHHLDREIYTAVFGFCNDNQQWLQQQQEKQMKNKEMITQRFRQLQLMQMQNNLPSPTPQELQFHTQTIMQNAIYKKQMEDYRNGHAMKQQGQQPKFQSYNKGNNFMPNQQYPRFNYKQKQNYGQNGLQFIQSQNKSSWNRQNQTNSIFGGSVNNGGMRNTNDLLAATMPSFAKFDASTMPNASDKFAIPAEK